MNRNLTLALALAAGLLGGFLSRNLAPASVHAQAPVPTEIRAQSFTLVDDQGSAVGTFIVRDNGAPVVTRGPGGSQGKQLPAPPAASRRIALLNSEGREIWSAGGPSIRTLAGNTNQ